MGRVRVLKKWQPPGAYFCPGPTAVAAPDALPRAIARGF